MSGKNLNLLGLGKQPNAQPTIHETISELQREIAKGEAVYTREELRRLSMKLEQYEELLRSLLSP